MRRTLLVLTVAWGCKGRSQSEPELPPPPPKVIPNAPAPADLVRAKATLGCLFDRARDAREVLTVLAEEAPLPVVRLAALTAIDRARQDGESPAAVVIADAISVLTEIDDFDGLRTAFAMADARPAPKGTRIDRDAPARARVGARSTPEGIELERVAVIRETALAGDLPTAMRMFAQLTPGDHDDSYEREPYLGALVVLGKLDEVRALIAAAKPEDRLKLTGIWLDAVLRQGAPIKDALAAALAELAVAPDKGVIYFPERQVFRRAARVKRAGELAPLYRALFLRLATTITSPIARAELDADLATALDDAAALKRLAADPSLATRFAVRSAPIGAALAAATGQKYPLHDLIRLWARSITQDTDPAFGAQLAASVCPPARPPAAAPTPAAPGLHVEVKEKARGKRQECRLHDVIVRLTDGKQTIEEQVLEGECHGACTAADKRAGEAQLAEIQKAIDSGEASESQTDYNFTDCIYSGPNPGRIDRVGDRDVALLVDHYIGAHDIDKDQYRIALEICGALYLSGTFGGTYVGAWALGELSLRETVDRRQIIVDGKSDRWRGVVFRLTLPTCPGQPTGQALESE
ncbi:MAG: hypothetical protein IPQ07_07565 [Myxococcales bacterium]|nr:hypothetical protein [Myxococcales bacterium]